jgi:hypothetical protein
MLNMNFGTEVLTELSRASSWPFPYPPYGLAHFCVTQHALTVVKSNHLNRVPTPDAVPADAYFIPFLLQIWNDVCLVQAA